MCLVAAINFGSVIKCMHRVRGGTDHMWLAGLECGIEVVGAFCNYWKLWASNIPNLYI
jgi:hypothetical protein